MRYLKNLFARQRAADRAFEERALEQLEQIISRAVDQDFPFAHRADEEVAHREPVPNPQMVLSIKFSSAEFDVLARVAEENETKVTVLAHDAIMDWLATTTPEPSDLVLGIQQGLRDETVEMPPLDPKPKSKKTRKNP